jgi:hypothetical protein
MKKLSEDLDVQETIFQTMTLKMMTLTTLTLMTDLQIFRISMKMMMTIMRKVQKKVKIKKGISLIKKKKNTKRKN